MKRYIALILGIALALSVSAYAVNLDDYMLDDGNYDMDGYHYALACEKAAPFGDALLPSAYWIASEDGMPPRVTPSSDFLVNISRMRSGNEV